MYAIRWAEDAFADLAEIISYIGNENPIAAQRYGEDFRQIIGLLKFMPKTFRVWELDNRFHCCAIVKPYLIIYQVNDKENFIRITRILHGKRKAPELD